MNQESEPEVPRCPNCNNPLDQIIEDIRGVVYVWSYNHETKKYERGDVDYYGETIACCFHCNSPITDKKLWDFWTSRAWYSGTKQ
jgi:hypothetical protein